MRNPFRRKTLLERVGESLGMTPRRVDTPAVRGALVAVGVVAATAAVSAVVSAIRENPGEEDGDDQS